MNDAGAGETELINGLQLTYLLGTLTLNVAIKFRLYKLQ
jgi:hypothetical protein